MNNPYNVRFSFNAGQKLNIFNLFIVVVDNKVYEKEINLLKQVDNLQKTDEETKFVQIATSIQSKLSEKKCKIEQYKSTIAELQKSIESLKSQNDTLKEKHLKLNVKYENLKSQLMDGVVRECEKCRHKLVNYENSNN